MSNTQQQAVPGQYFRWPLLSAQPRQIPEPGPCAPDLNIALKQGTTVVAPFGHFENLDIVRGYLLELDYDLTFTAGSGETITQSPLFPLNLIQSISVSLQAAYKTLELPGWLAAVMQQYRSFQAPKAFTTDVQAGANVAPRNAQGSLNYNGLPALATPNLAITSGAAQQFSSFIEVPVASYFDLYWEIDPQDGSAIAAVPRAIVSPARMAATQRNVTPQVKFNPLFSTGDTYDSPASIASGDTTSTAVGSVNASWWRSGWVPTDNPLTEPIGYAWQAARMGLDFQPAGAQKPIINLADDRAGQGQILSLVFGTWDPALNSGGGGFTPPSDVEKLKLSIGSTVVLYDDTPNTNALRWASQHGRALPFGLYGWDLALTEDGRLTNENALNTLVQSGVQLSVEYLASAEPSNSATIFVGIESLQAVTN